MDLFLPTHHVHILLAGDPSIANVREIFSKILEKYSQKHQRNTLENITVILVLPTHHVHILLAGTQVLPMSEKYFLRLEVQGPLRGPTSR